MDGGYYVIGDMKGNGSGFRAIFARLLEYTQNPYAQIFYIDAGGNQVDKCRQDFKSAIERVNPRTSVSALKLKPDMAAYELAGINHKLEKGFMNSDITFFEAGNIKVFRETFAQFNLANLAARARANGAFVGGLCGGGSFLAEQVIYDEDGQTRSEKGVGLISDTAISCKLHPSKPKFEERMILLNDSLTQKFARQAIGIGVDQAIVFAENNIQAIPTGREKDGQPIAINDRLVSKPISFYR